MNMKLLCSIFTVLLLQIPSYAISVKTMSQDNSAIKYNATNVEKPGICIEVIRAHFKTFVEVS